MIALDAITLDFYDAAAPGYARRFAAPSRHLDAFLAQLPPGARILELGCGGGRDAAAMIARGFEVDATDGSPALAAQAAAFLGRPVRVMRFDQLAVVEAYDAVWANACLLHVPHDALAAVLGQVWRVLRPGGLHAASYKIGAGEARDRFGHYYNLPDVPESLRAYRAAGAWDVVAVERFAGRGYDRAESDWAGLAMRRRSSDP